MARAVLVLVSTLAALATGAQATRTATFEVASITDGDTLRLTTGARVRLLQVDAPELGSGDCYSRASRTALLHRVPVGSRVVLEADPRLDRVDRFGRLLRYVRRGTMNVNLALARMGAVAPYFFEGERGKYAGRLLAEATRAKAARRGLWGACPRAVLDPTRQLQTGRSGGSPRGNRGRGIVGEDRCDPSYPGVCIPPYPPDVDCRDVPYSDFAVRPPDPHGFDGDGDGYGCES